MGIKKSGDAYNLFAILGKKILIVYLTRIIIFSTNALIFEYLISSKLYLWLNTKKVPVF
jgi:hypothetical protein